MREPFLMTILLLFPVAEIILSFVRKGESSAPMVTGTSSRILRHWPKILFSILAILLANRLKAPLTFTILATLPLALFLPEEKHSLPKGKTRNLPALLLWFFAAGFLISPDPLWAIIFWEGVLASLLLLGAFGPLSGESLAPRIEQIPNPIIWSAILFPISQWLSGTLPGEHIAPSPVAFFLGIFSLALLIPSAPFMKWLYIYPRDAHFHKIVLIRIATTIVASDGICRFVIPQISLWGKTGILSSGTFEIGKAAILASALLATFQGLALAFTEPILSRRVAYLSFSESALLPPAILLGGEHWVTILTLVSATLVLSTLSILIPLAHIERETRRRSASALGGLLTNMPRTGLVMGLGSLAFSGFPGLALASAFSLFPFSGETLAAMMLFLAAVTATGILLGRTLAGLFLGEDPKSTYRPKDLSRGWAWTGILLLIPLIWMAVLPPGTDEKVPHATVSLAHAKTGFGK